MLPHCLRQWPLKVFRFDDLECGKLLPENDRNRFPAVRGRKSYNFRLVNPENSLSLWQYFDFPRVSLLQLVNFLRTQAEPDRDSKSIVIFAIQFLPGLSQVSWRNGFGSAGDAFFLLKTGIDNSLSLVTSRIRNWQEWLNHFARNKEGPEVGHS